MRTKTARYHSYYWAQDLNQWIPNLTTKVALEYTKHGNLRVVNAIDYLGYTKAGVGAVFNREGYCISRTPKYSFIKKGLMPRWYKLTNIDLGK